MRVLAVLLTLLLFAPPAMGQDDKGKVIGEAIDSLKGVDAVCAVAADVPQLESEIPRASLQTLLELKLRQNGITVLSGGICELSPTLVLTTSLLVSRNSTQAYHVYALELTLLQLLTKPLRAKDEPMLYRVGTWNKSLIGISPVDEYRRIRAAIEDDLLPAFLNDYLTANPRKP